MSGEPRTSDPRRGPGAPPAPGDLLTPPEAATILRTTTGQLRKLRYLGQGPAYHKPGPQTVRYTPADLAAFVAATRRD